MKLYAKLKNEHNKEVKIGGNTALTLTAYYGNNIAGELVILEGSIALYNKQGQLVGEIEKGKSHKGEKICEECGTNKDISVYTSMSNDDNKKYLCYKCYRGI